MTVKKTLLMKEPDDAAIIYMIKDDSLRDKGFLLLMDKYKKPIYWHIRRLVISHEDAEDILQETFIQVYRFYDSFKGESKIYTWLYRIATNECIRHFRKNENNEINEGFIDEKMSGGLAETDTEASDVILLKFQKAVLLLPERQKIVFNLRYYDELSYEDISKILNSSVNSLKTNYHYACEKIKQYLVDNA
jgi:RNA polymerase sigma-70 factor, ECF subfamily